MGKKSAKVKVTVLYHGCSACPSQWEGKTADGGYIYVRYRWGQLTIGHAMSMAAAVFSQNIVNQRINDGLDGYIPYEELVELTKDEVEWLPPDKVKLGHLYDSEEEENQTTSPTAKQG